MILSATFRCDGRDLELEVEDHRDRIGSVFLNIDSVGDLTYAESALIAAAITMIAAQACLAESVRLDFPVQVNARDSLLAIARILYGSHAYAQRRDWLDPTIAFLPEQTPSEISLPEPKSSDDPALQPTAVLLWSGGKDALAALKSLRANGYVVHGLHATANLVAADRELSAAVHLAKMYNLPLICVRLRWDFLRDFNRKHSSKFDKYPAVNAVPHGRDLALVVIAAIVATRVGAAFVCAGYETDLLDKTVIWNGKSIARHDIQSRVASKHVNELTKTLGSRFFSPIASVREFSILHGLFFADPSPWKYIESCFWGGWCGECTKCLRYDLAQRYFGVQAIAFRKNPISRDSIPFGLLVSDIANRDTPYWEQQVFCVFELARRGDPVISDLIGNELRSYLPWYDTIREAIRMRLEEQTPDPLAPPGYRWPTSSWAQTDQE
jgi:7-cyano-7-deazaguanine synthase in queuosine biosynthesis